MPRRKYATEESLNEFREDFNKFKHDFLLWKENHFAHVARVVSEDRGILLVLVPLVMAILGIVLWIKLA